jgi:hypothetical protein
MPSVVFDVVGTCFSYDAGAEALQERLGDKLKEAGLSSKLLFYAVRPLCQEELEAGGTNAPEGACDGRGRREDGRRQALVASAGGPAWRAANCRPSLPPPRLEDPGLASTPSWLKFVRCPSDARLSLSGFAVRRGITATSHRSTNINPSSASSSTPLRAFSSRRASPTRSPSIRQRMSRCDPRRPCLPLRGRRLTLDPCRTDRQYIMENYKKLKPRPGMAEMMQILRDGGFTVRAQMLVPTLTVLSLTDPQLLCRSGAARMPTSTASRATLITPASTCRWRTSCRPTCARPASRTRLSTRWRARRLDPTRRARSASLRPPTPGTLPRQRAQGACPYLPTCRCCSAPRANFVTAPTPASTPPTASSMRTTSARPSLARPTL